MIGIWNWGFNRNPWHPGASVSEPSVSYGSFTPPVLPFNLGWRNDWRKFDPIFRAHAANNARTLEHIAAEAEVLAVRVLTTGINVIGYPWGVEVPEEITYETVTNIRSGYGVDPYSPTSEVIDEITDYVLIIGPAIAGARRASPVRVDIRYSNRQLGRKFGEHRDPSRPGYRTHHEYAQRANEIRNSPASRKTVFPESHPVYPGETHYQLGDELLRLDANGNFRSLYPVDP